MSKNFGNLVKEVKLKDGSWLFELRTTKRTKEKLYKAALLYTDITAEDLKYQAKHNPDQSFKDTLIGAFVYHAGKNRVEQEEKLKKSKKTQARKRTAKVKSKSKKAV